MAYIIHDEAGRPTTRKTSAAAIAHAVSIAPRIPGSDVTVWSRPFWAVAVVRHYPELDDTLVHRFDRYGRELPGRPAAEGAV